MNKLLKTQILNNSRISEAFWFAAQAHGKQLRKSGQPYIIHPVSVASMLIEYGYSDEVSIIAAILHDVVEDSSCTVGDIRSRFGDTVAFLVDGVTKDSGCDKQYEDKLVTYSRQDERVALIKAFDRMHNLETIEYLKPNKKQKFLAETKDFYLSFFSDHINNPSLITALSRLAA